ncbi:MAG: hypothetical protein ACHQHN_17940 [Sphingobacteriales bacterium]
MKKILSIVFVMVSLQVFAQTNPITAINITLPSNPDANTANWGTGASLFMISATAKSATGRVNPAVEESRILVLIKKGGNKFCGSYTGSTAVASGFSTITKVWSGSNAVSLLGKDCTLPPGDYELSVQFFGNGPVGTIPLSDEKTKPFTIKGNDQQTYQPPQAIAPANGSAFSETDINKPITFRWTPVIPKPQEPVTYRLSIWQLMQGQTGPQAMKANQPIFTKDVDNITQAVVSNILTGPCKPPYMCDFVWNVQALNREGKPIGSNNGMSGVATFRKEGTIVPFDTMGYHITLISPEHRFAFPAGGLPVFTWKSDTKLPTGAHYRLTIVKLPGTASPQATGNKPFFEKDSLLLFSTNKPFFEKDSLDAMVLQYPSSAPKLMGGAKFAWKVDIVGRSGKTTDASGIKGFATTGAADNGNGTTRSDMDSYGVTVQNLVVACTKASSHTFTINVGNPNNSTAIFDKLEIVSINGTVLSTPIPATSVSPATGSNIPAYGNINVSAAFNYSNTLNIVCIKAYIKQQSNPTMNTAGSYECDTLKCCWPCDMNQVTVSNSSIAVTDAANGVIQVQNTISATPNNITKIQADLVYVKISPVNDNCNQCNKQQKEQDNFIGRNFIANGSQWKNNGNGAISYNSVNGITRSLTFTSNNASGVNISPGIQMTHSIGLPPNSCCGDVVEVWIRYTVWDTGCHVCSQLIKATVARNNLCATNGGNGTTIIIKN